MRNADSFAADVLPWLMGVTTPLLDRTLLRVAQDFCRRTRCWTVWTEPVLLTPDATEYEAEVPEYGVPELVEAVSVDGRPGDLVPWRWLDRPVEDAATGSIVASGRLFFAPGHSRPGSRVSLKVVAVPGDQSPGVPDAVFDAHSAALANGVIAQCLLIPGQAFTNPQLAASHGAAYGEAVSREALREWRGRTNATPRQRVRWC